MHIAITTAVLKAMGVTSVTNIAMVAVQLIKAIQVTVFTTTMGMELVMHMIGSQNQAMAGKSCYKYIAYSFLY